MEIKTERESPAKAPMGGDETKKPGSLSEAQLPKDETNVRESAQKAQAEKRESVMDQLGKKTD